MKPQQFAAYAITQIGLALVAVCLLAVSPPVFAATPQEAAWSGQATCAVNVQSPGYSYQETQTWTITPGAPTLQGQMQVYPASWSASGNGATQRPQGAQALQATWNSTVPGISAPIAVFFRGYDKRLIIKAWHSQLRQQASIRGTRLVSAAGAAPTQSALVSDAYEWQFPTVESDPTGTTVSGSGTVEVGGGYLLLQPTMASTKAACQWEFVEGAASPAQLPSDELNSGPTSLPPASASSANPTQNLGSTSVSSIPVPQPPAAVPMMSQPTISQPMISQPMPSQPTVPTTPAPTAPATISSHQPASSPPRSGNCPAGQSSCSGACVDTTLDLNNCGSCGNKCAVANGGSSCTNGSCGVPPDSPFASGPTACGSAAASVSHQNGTGQVYNDCANALATPGNGQTYSRSMAFEAASAFSGNPAAVSDMACAPAGLAVSATANGSCAVWVYTGNTAGHVNLDTKGACTCPAVTDKSWN